MRKQRTQLKAFLADLPLFEKLSDEGLSRLAARAAEIEAPRRTVVCRRGDACLGMHVVVAGQIKLSLQTLHGDERVIELVAAGQSFGESVLFANLPYMSSAETLADSKLVHIPKAAVLAELEKNPRFALCMIASLSARLNHLINDVEGYTLRSGTQRVSRFLLTHLALRGDRVEPTLTFPAKKGIIASHLNLTHEHFSRILHELSAQGLIEVRGRVVRILDPERLQHHPG